MVADSFGNRNFMQPMGRLSMHSKCLDFFSFNLGGRGWEDFFHFSFVLSMFPSSSQYVLQVPNVFPKGVPNITLLESHRFCPKSSPSHRYRWDEGGKHSIFP